MTATLDPADPLSDAVRAGIGAEITRFLTDRTPTVEAISQWVPPSGVSTGFGLLVDPEIDQRVGTDELALVRQLAVEATAGGKRLRPAFALWGCVAAGGTSAVTAPVWTAAASLDLLHVSALVHDDVMDSSDLRRGKPAAHKQFEAFHRTQGWSGDPAVFGRAGAILLGDLLVLWSAEMVDRAGLPPEALAGALPELHAMRTEVTLGQLLDVMAQSRPPAGDLADRVLAAQRVVEHKSAKYTVQRPLLFGAALAGGPPEVTAALASYGSAIGRAFQYRDDLLGVFGEESVTGKPAGDDLREGKRTLLVAHTRERLSDPDRSRFDMLFGRADLDTDGRDELSRLITASGARADVEAMIDSLHAEAIAVITEAPFTTEGHIALLGLAEAAVRRTS